MKVTVKGLLVVALPLVLLMLMAYVYTRTQHRAIQSRMNAVVQQNDVMQGELYKLRQDVTGRDARISMLVHPDLLRLKAVSLIDSSSCWLFRREADSACYAEVSHAKKLDVGLQYRLYGIKAGQPEFIGGFESIAETVGLQKIGKASLLQGSVVTMAIRDSEPDFEAESKVYQVMGPF